jgi:acyl-CoA synthetase (AMP-forming)/AMP-acid ligase II
MRLTRQLLILTRRGVLTPGRPDRIVRQVASLLTWGAGIAGEIRQAAARSPDAVAVVDQTRGEVTYAALLASCERAAHVLLAQGVSAGDRVGLLCRNHLGLVELLGGASTAGIDVVLLNTGLAAGQVHDVVGREGISLLVHDEEFGELTRGLSVPRLGEHAFLVLMDALMDADAATGRLRPPRRAGRVVVLTSGTTGPPKGARRPHPRSLAGLASVLDRIPLRPRETVLLSAPIFHTWGFGALQLALAMRDTVVLQRRFDAPVALAALAEHPCQVLFAVPVMLQRLLGDVAEVGRDGPGDAAASLRIAAVSGSSLTPGLAPRFMAAFGPVLYNVYGSTEVSWAAIADPADLQAAPDCSGRPPYGTRIAIVGDDRTEAPAGQVGRVFVGNEMLFSGYTDGGGRARWRGLVDTGDLGHLEDGRLHLDGREDDLVVSGGENVYPVELEAAIGGLPEVLDVTAFGVADDEFGQRLVACVVPQPGVSLEPGHVIERVTPLVSRQALPREVRIVDTLPRNPTGKVLVGELRKHFLAH